MKKLEMGASGSVVPPFDRERWRSIRCRDPYHRIGTLGEIRRARDNHGWPDLGFLGADQDADHYIAGLQSRSTDSSASKRRKDAAL